MTKSPTKTPDILRIAIAQLNPTVGDVAGYLTDELTLAASRNPAFRVVERDLSRLNQELAVQLSDLVDVRQGQRVEARTAILRGGIPSQ